MGPVCPAAAALLRGPAVDCCCACWQEGAMGGYNEHLEGNLPCNPWNVNHWAGASSSGSGVATAAGFAYSTLGSDTVRP